MENNTHRDRPCPCTSGLSFEACCGPIIRGEENARTALALMRSRYTAYVLGDADYLRASWHASTRPAELHLAVNESGWCGLEILHCESGRPGDVSGRVHFRARARQGVLEENSRFRFEDGCWYYLDGELIDAPPANRKVGRNEPCPCGSGRKYKKCCGQ
mgnify:CR=1 FL=1